MRITNFIKNYPTIVITIIILSSGISGILIQSKVYASTEKANTPGCNCKQKPCNPGNTNTYPGGRVPCVKEFYKKNEKCVCETNEIFTGDPYDVMSGVWEICQGKKTGTGCICDYPCEEIDCKDPSCVNQCSITTYKMYCEREWLGYELYRCLFCSYDASGKRECTNKDCH